MAEECGESTTVISSSSTPPNWWHDLHASGSSSSNNISAAWTGGGSSTTSWHPNPNPPTSSTSTTADDDASMSISYTTNTSNNHSVITNESASHHLVEPSPSNVLIPGHFQDNHLLSPLVCVGSSMSRLDNSNNLMDQESKSMLDPAFDYLKKWDNNNHCSWEDIPPHQRMIDVEGQRLTNNLVSSNNNGSLLFPHPQTCSMSLGTSSEDQVASSGFCNLKQMLMSDSTSNSSRAVVNRDNIGNYNGLMTSPFKRNAYFQEEQEHNIQTTNNPPLFCGLSHNGNNNNNDMEFPFGMKISSLLGGYGIASRSPAYTRIKNQAEDGAPSFIPASRFSESERVQDSSSISDCKRRFMASSPPIRVNVRGHVHTTTEGKKRRAEQTSEAVLKKTKTNHNNNNESSTVSSSPKMQAPKAKLGDRITALQQIVSPFGKTDTASVLMEAIAYIKCLQEQVQLLVSNPYLKMNPHKDHWFGGMDRKNDNEDDVTKIDLRSKGLCLMPISCTPQIYRDTTAGSDFLTPPYRGILYRSSNC